MLTFTFPFVGFAPCRLDTFCCDAVSSVIVTINTLYGFYFVSAWHDPKLWTLSLVCLSYSPLTIFSRSSFIIQSAPSFHVLCLQRCASVIISRAKHTTLLALSLLCTLNGSSCLSHSVSVSA